MGRRAGFVWSSAKIDSFGMILRNPFPHNRRRASQLSQKVCGTSRRNKDAGQAPVSAWGW